ncbi:hypothetical protein E1261_44235, partial [Kribbella albertanoniae]
MLTRRLLLTATVLAPVARAAQSVGLVGGGAGVEPAAPWTSGPAAVATPAAATGSRATPAVQLRFPRPTGPFHVGTTELHLVDAGRTDPWVTGRARELMVSVWYPAVGVGERAVYLPRGTAEV